MELFGNAHDLPCVRGCGLACLHPLFQSLFTHRFILYGLPQVFGDQKQGLSVGHCVMALTVSLLICAVLSSLGHTAIGKFKCPELVCLHLCL